MSVWPIWLIHVPSYAGWLLIFCSCNVHLCPVVWQVFISPGAKIFYKEIFLFLVLTCTLQGSMLSFCFHSFYIFNWFIQINFSLWFRLKNTWSNFSLKVGVSGSNYSSLFSGQRNGFFNCFWITYINSKRKFHYDNSMKVYSILSTSNCNSLFSRVLNLCIVLL
jgi:hypothetical protein